MSKTVWKLTLAYDGTGFHGWQIQPELATIQGTLADAIAAVTGERVLPQGAGRTDAGVHAAGQVASFSLAAPIPAENLRRALNRVLCPAIRVLAAERVASDFHARHSARGKIYQYRVFQDRGFGGEACSPFIAPYVACWRWPLDLAAMQQAAREILGEHDFTSFAASDPDRAARLAEDSCHEDAVESDAMHMAVDSNIRRIDRSQWSHAALSESSMEPLALIHGIDAEEASDAAKNENRPQIFTYTICGNGFLHHMVRNLVGTFLEVGRGRLAPGDIARILSGRDRSLAGPTAAASGLCLMQVLY